MWNKVRITATGNVANLGRGNIYGGIVTQAAGASSPTLAVYDATADTAAFLITPVTATGTTNVAGAFTGPIGSSVSALTAVPPMVAGIVLERGLHVVIVGTGWTGWVLYK